VLVVFLLAAMSCGDDDEDDGGTDLTSTTETTLPAVTASFKTGVCKALGQQAVGNVAQEVVNGIIRAVSRQRIQNDVLGLVLTNVATNTCPRWVDHVDSLLPRVEEP
jgi:hypothetical protein